MKIKINKTKFLDHLTTAGRAIQSNSALPSLHGFLITATESNIQIIASNGNLSIKEIIDPSEGAQVIEPGKILIPGSLFKNVIKRQSSEVEIFTENNSLIIKSGDSKTSIQLMNENEYPTLSFDAVGKELVVDGAALEELIKNVSFAASENDKRIILNGVNLKAKDGFLVATATNSFRLAQEKIEVDSNSEFEITIISKNLKDFAPKGVNGPLHISVNDAKIITKHKSTTIMSKLIDGVYPDVSGFIPKEFNHALQIDVKELTDMINKATVVAEESNKVIRVTIDSEELVIESKRKEIGDSIVKSKEFKWRGEQLIIALNAQFLLEAISKFKGNIVIGLNGSHDPLVVKSASNENLTQLILPHRSY